jgi:hypothetical protein
MHTVWMRATLFACLLLCMATDRRWSWSTAELLCRAVAVVGVLSVFGGAERRVAQLDDRGHGAADPALPGLHCHDGESDCTQVPGVCRVPAHHRAPHPVDARPPGLACRQARQEEPVTPRCCPAPRPSPLPLCETGGERAHAGSAYGLFLCLTLGHHTTHAPGRGGMGMGRGPRAQRCTASSCCCTVSSWL